MANGEGMAFPEAIQAVDLPERVAGLVAEYNQRIGIRDDFVWRWMYSLLPEFQLSCVADDHEETARVQKTLLTLFVTILDDTAEHNQDKATFEAMRQLPFPAHEPSMDRAAVNQAAVDVAGEVWDAFERELTAAPRYAEFNDQFRFDLRQTINAMDYSRLVSAQPAVSTLTDAYHYDAHNMVLFAYTDIDLMYAPSFRRQELGSLRETVWDCQQLARIGNWLTTWDRELAEGDYSSGVVIAAIEEGLIDPETLRDDPTPDEVRELVARIEAHDIETRFEREWRHEFADISAHLPATDSVDLEAFVAGMETVYDYHQQSHGYK